MNSVLLLYFVGKKNANQIHFEVHSIYSDKCITKRTVHILCKKMLVGQNFVSFIYRGAISRSSVAWITASIVLCIGHSEVC